MKMKGRRLLTTESIESFSLTLEGVDDIHRGDSLSFGVFAVGDGISDDIFEEDFEDATSFFIDESGDPLHTTTTSKTANGWFGDS